MNTDNISPPGAWQAEWDKRSHTSAEYQQEIRELRERIVYYISYITKLEDALETERARSNDWNREP